MAKKTNVKPHQRKNPKSQGKHSVSGHTRSVTRSNKDFQRQIGGTRAIDEVRGKMETHNSLYGVTIKTKEKLGYLYMGDDVPEEHEIEFDIASLGYKVDMMKDWGMVSDDVAERINGHVSSAKSQFLNGNYDRAYGKLQDIQDIIESHEYNKQLAEWMEGDK